MASVVSASSVASVSIDDNDFRDVDDNDSVFAATIDSTRQPEIDQHNVDARINYALEKMLSEIRVRPNSKCKHIVRLAPVIQKYGLTSTQIEQLLDIIFYQKLNNAQAAQRISLLLPRTTVPEKQILRIYGNLSCREYDPIFMQALLSWVLSIYKYIDGKEHINKMYCVLFHYLNLEKLRPHICHLLFIMTKKVHVKQYRIRFLLDMAEKVAHDPNLGALLKVFHSFRPDFDIPMKYRLSKKSAFYRVDISFENALIKLRKLWIDGTTPAMPSDKFIFQEPDRTETDNRPRKQQRIQYKNSKLKNLKDPDIDVFDPNEILTYVDQQSIPEQITGALTNRMIQHAIICKPYDVVIPRLCDILAQQLMDNLRWNRHTLKSLQILEDLLHKILNLARLSKAHIPVVETFLGRYLRSWNGIDCVDEIFELLTYIKPSSFPVIFESYLKPLNRLYCVSDVRWKAKLILCYRDWLKHWALLDWHRHVERRKSAMDEGTENIVDDLAWLFQGLSFNVDYFGVMQQMIYHVDRLCVQGLTLEQDHPLLQHASLSFFEFTASISLHHDIPTVIIPAASLVYRSFFSSNAMAVSRICGILYKYKLSFENNERQVDDWTDKNSDQYMEHFNTYVLDICNCLWRNLAFDYLSDDTTPFSLSVDTIAAFNEKCEQRGDTLHLLFSLTHSSAFVGYSKHFMKIKAEELGLLNQANDPVTVESVKALVDSDGVAMTYLDYRVEYLEYLKDLGFRGVYDLLYTFMASLIERKKLEQEFVESESTSSVII